MFAPLAHDVLNWGHTCGYDLENNKSYTTVVQKIEDIRQKFFRNGLNS